MLQRNTYDLTLNITPFLEPWQCLNFISGPIILVFEYCCLVRKRAMMFFCKLGGQALYLHLDVVDMLLICSMLVFMYYLCDFRLCCVFCWYVPLFSLTASTDASWEDRQRGNHDEENMSRANKLRHQHHKLSTWQTMSGRFHYIQTSSGSLSDCWSLKYLMWYFQDIVSFFTLSTLGCRRQGHAGSWLRAEVTSGVSTAANELQSAFTDWTRRSTCSGSSTFRRT